MLFKVEYWNGQKRYIDSRQKEAVEMAIVKGKPFRLTHSNGVDFVQPKAIALITEPTWREYTELPSKKYKALPEIKELPEGDRIPAEIMELLKESIKAKLTLGDKQRANELREAYERKLNEWRKKRKIV